VGGNGGNNGAGTDGNLGRVVIIYTIVSAAKPSNYGYIIG
jgi:hypothetical protein